MCVLYFAGYAGRPSSIREHDQISDVAAMICQLNADEHTPGDSEPPGNVQFVNDEQEAADEQQQQKEAEADYANPGDIVPKKRIEFDALWKCIVLLGTVAVEARCRHGEDVIETIQTRPKRDRQPDVVQEQIEQPS